MGTHLYERLVAERFRRVWAVAELIAFEPGVTRQQMAKRFFVSERQIQADLYIVGNEMGLSLGRQSGYRFLDARGGACPTRGPGRQGHGPVQGG